MEMCIAVCSVGPTLLGHGGPACRTSAFFLELAATMLVLHPVGESGCPPSCGIPAVGGNVHGLMVTIENMQCPSRPIRLPL